MTKQNKKGFTLVELLAVIAILAILMLLITPNVLKLFTQGKEDAFRTQVQRIWKAAEQEYLTASMRGENPGPYCYAGSDTDNQLSITENKKLYYYVTYEAEGDISVLKVSDGTYYYDSEDTDSVLGLDSITVKSGSKKFDCTSGETSAR